MGEVSSKGIGRVDRRTAFTRIITASLGFGATTTTAAAQPSFKPAVVVMQRGTITSAGANALIAAAVAKTLELGFPPMSVAVVDDCGILKAFTRMDGAGPAGVDIVQNKAYTAAAFRAPTQVLAQRFQDQPTAIASFTTTPRVTLLPGGLPIVVNGAVIGGIGVGGGSGEQDVIVAQAAIDEVVGS